MTQRLELWPKHSKHSFPSTFLQLYFTQTASLSTLSLSHLSSLISHLSSLISHLSSLPPALLCFSSGPTAYNTYIPPDPQSQTQYKVCVFNPTSTVSFDPRLGACGPEGSADNPATHGDRNRIRSVFDQLSCSLLPFSLPLTTALLPSVNRPCPTAPLPCPPNSAPHAHVPQPR
jgi:hypothetical protein